MSTSSPQNFENHPKMVPLYHYATAALIVLPLFWFLYRTIFNFSPDNLAILAMAIGLLFAGFFARVFPAGAQDRVIRLEERLRLAKLLPADLVPRIEEITTAQLVALRFAPDDELPDLVRRVLAKELVDQPEIKKQIKSWRADHQRI